MLRRVARWLVAVAIGLAFFLLFRDALSEDVLRIVYGTLLVWAAGQWAAARFLSTQALRAAVVIALDLLSVATLVWTTGGAQSPWSALFGLVILGAAFEAGSLAPPAAAVGASALWLMIGYATRSAPSALEMLLQVSGWLLAGGVMGALVRRRAMSERTASEALRAHRRLQRLHAAVLAAMREGVVLVSRDGKALDANEAARAMLGNDWAEAIEQLVKEQPVLQQALEKGIGAEIEVEVEPDALWLVRLTPLLAPAAGGTEGVLTLVDVSRVRHLERRLAEQARLAELGRMSAMLAHEIRNPLQSLRQGTDLLKSGNVQEEVLDILQQEVQRLARLVESMLDFTRPLAARPRRCRPAEVLAQACASLAPEQRARVVCNADKAKAVLDPDLMRLVVDNLLHNALSAGKGQVRLCWQQKGDGWQLIVEDECGGVPEDLREQLFEPFVSGRARGIGLGLATVKRACEAAGWCIRLEDAPKGTRFVVEGERATGQNGGDGDSPAR